MNLLAQHGLHELRDERWNAYGQFSWISGVSPRSRPRTRTSTAATIRSCRTRSGASRGPSRLFSASVSGRAPRSISCPRSSPSGRSRSSPASAAPSRIRAPEDGLGDADALQIQALSATDHRARRPRGRQVLGSDAARQPGRQPALRPHGGQLQHSRLLRPELVLGRFPAAVLQHGVPHVRGLRLRRRRPGLCVGRHRRALPGRLGDSIRSNHAAAGSEPAGHRFRISGNFTAISSRSSTTTSSSGRRIVRDPRLSQSREHGPIRRRHRRAQRRSHEERQGVHRVQLRLDERLGAGSLLGAEAERQAGRGAQRRAAPHRRHRRVLPRDDLRRADRGVLVHVGGCSISLGGLAKGSAWHRPPIRSASATGRRGSRARTPSTCARAAWTASWETAG